MQRSRFITLIVIYLLCTSVLVCAADCSTESALPAPACADGWLMEEKPILYDKDTLFERVNGESELYFPYGFEVLVSARYANKEKPPLAVEVDVYTMGSLLDAFGTYANYRRSDDVVVRIGGEGSVSSSQLLFYQDRYFVRLQASGTASLEQDVFLACARAVSQNLPGTAGQPRELGVFMIPAIVPRSERYIPQSLLGYSFFRRGITADAVLEGERALVFVVTEDSPGTAREAFDQYRSYLTASGQDTQVTENTDGVSLSAIDPLYKGVFVEQSGRYVIGAVRVTETSGAKQVVEQIRRRLSGEQGN